MHFNSRLLLVLDGMISFDARVVCSSSLVSVKEGLVCRIQGRAEW